MLNSQANDSSSVSSSSDSSSGSESSDEEGTQRRRKRPHKKHGDATTDSLGLQGIPTSPRAHSKGHKKTGSGSTSIPPIIMSLLKVLPPASAYMRKYLNVSLTKIFANLNYSS